MSMEQKAKTKADLIDMVCAKAMINRVRAETLVNAVFDAMTEALVLNERIEIRGFGSFVNRNYEAYRGRNPKTGEVIEVPAKRQPHFKVGRNLLNTINLGRKLP